LASGYLDGEAYTDAMVILKGMLKSAPHNSDLNYLMGVTEDASGDKQAAINYLKKVKASSNFFQNAVLHIAFLYQGLKQIPKAIRTLEDAAGKIPSSADLYLYLGSFYEEVDQLDKAVAAFQKGLKVDPDNVKIHFRLGVTYDKKGDRRASIGEMKRVIQLDPSHANALNYLGYTYAEMGIELDQAEKMVLKALEKEPNDGYITDSLGWIYFKKGQMKKAVSTMQKAVSLVPDDPTILEHMGDVYLKAAEPAKALEFYRRSLKNQDKAKDQEPGAVKKIEEKIRSLSDKGK
jgi:tetratricopeptide (TPR) repeat protein